VVRRSVVVRPQPHSSTQASQPPPSALEFGGFSEVRGMRRACGVLLLWAVLVLSASGSSAAGGSLDGGVNEWGGACSGGRPWPAPCDAPLEQLGPCSAAATGKGLGEESFHAMVVLLNSFEKLTWATVGLGRLLAMANSSAGVSLVEPCIADSGLRRLQLPACNSTMPLLQSSLHVAPAEIGGFGHPDWLQLDTYFDTERLRSTLRPDALVTVADYVRIARCSRRIGRSALFARQVRARRQRDEVAWARKGSQADAMLDPARSLDALIVFVWWEEERAGLQFQPPLGLVECHERLLWKGHIRRVRVEGADGKGDSEYWFEVDKMKVCAASA